MRVIKGCTGTTTWGQSAPGAAASQSPDQATRSSSPLGRPQKTKSCEAATTSTSRPRHTEEKTAEAQLCLSQAHGLLLGEATLWNAHCRSEIRRCSNETENSVVLGK